MGIVLGAIADDFTGATDLANTLVGEGMSVVQVIGVPTAGLGVKDVDAVVVALKSRTAPVEEAVAQSRAALGWLTAQGASQIVFKYCSTFDSTPEGNIGPVADALLSETGEELAIICPAFPANQRTIYKGTLFVSDLPLSESSMKDHPLTPMRDSSLLRLMDAQSRHRTGLIPLEVVRDGQDSIRECIEALKSKGRRYAVADALIDDDMRTIGAAIADHRLVTGGSGIALGLTDNFRAQGRLGAAAKPALPQVSGRALVIAGSCSTATRAQIERVRSHWPTRKIDIDRVAEGEDVVTDIVDWTLRQPDDTPVLVYGSSDPDEVARTQEKYGLERAGKMVEDTLAGISTALHAKGFTRIVVAGGETSGAVVNALNVKVLQIGPEIAPGVPWTEAVGTSPLALALKSGNFGSETFFEDAFGKLG